MDIQVYLSELKAEVDRCLDRLLPGEHTDPVTIHRAMRYSVFAGGKRVRPILVLAAGESVGGVRGALLHLGAGIEMMHTYSLIHDDLPALDNDDLRRGRPTCHKVFGDAMAILAGDALMTRSYQVLADLPGVADPVRLAIIREIAFATGTVEAMIGGQVVDLEAEGKPVEASVLEYIHRSKTGALLTACTRCAALAAGADSGQLRALTEYGRKIGLAFQIIDDILDVTCTSEELGKTAGKDQKAKKATYPALYGIEASRRKARELILGAVEEVRDLGERAEPLRELAQFVCSRTA
ncbi:MAG: farnesyl-diphosphate synthase [Acidobacteria bacterium]|jgi:geranylgeranyl diphosphate synthase type II|nr:farnesyl-diphosphate synthase [Acidobacteriota bacterium]